MIDILISGGTVVTMDPSRQVIEDGAVAIEGGRILEVGRTDELLARYTAARTIDARRQVVLPGLIDGHCHAGHPLTKSLGGDDTDQWHRAIERIYAQESSEEFWHADALLSSVERLKGGTTTSLVYLGGGDRVIRTDDVRYGDLHCEAVRDVGVREFLAVGPNTPPFPHRYVQWDGHERREVMVGFERQMLVSEALIQKWHNKAEGRIRICMASPVIEPDKVPDRSELDSMCRQVQDVCDLSRRYSVLYAQDSHTRGTVEFAYNELGVLGPDALLAHATNLTPHEIEICRATDSRVVHNPTAIAAIVRRCPVPELLDAGVTVMLGSDGNGPDRGFDMFRHMFYCMRYHRTSYHDPRVMPPGKVLEMVTVDAARALGLEKEIGSLEAGKQADVILVDMYKPHLYPFHMPVHRLLYFAFGSDVDTVIVQGKVVMEGREVKTVDESEVLERAQRAADEAMAAGGFAPLLEIPEGFWGRSRY